VVDQQRQLVSARHPQRAHHGARGGAQARASREQCLLGQRGHVEQAIRRRYRTRLWHVQRCGSRLVADAQSQHGVPVDERLQDEFDVRPRHTGRRQYHHRLVELVDRPLDCVEPVHDRSGQDFAGTVVGGPQATLAHRRDLGEPRHGLLDEDVAGPARDPGRPGTGDDLHRQDAVATEIEERIVDAHLVEPEDVCVDVREHALDGGGRSPVPGARNVIRRG
jgi:hypothetical protein